MYGNYVIRLLPRTDGSRVTSWCASACSLPSKLPVVGAPTVRICIAGIGAPGRPSLRRRVNARCWLRSFARRGTSKGGQEAPDVWAIHMWPNSGKLGARVRIQMSQTGSALSGSISGASFSSLADVRVR